MPDKPPPTFGWNTSDGVVHCRLCDWQYKCRSIEEIEMRLARHLKDVHQRKLIYRVVRETGEQIDIPEVD